MRNNKVNTQFRFNFLTTIIYIVGIILLLQLFNLQIIHGAEYREKSNTRLTRESTIKADRGSILDKTGNTIVGNGMGFSVDLYKTKIDDATLNKTILKMITTLEKNGDSYQDNFILNVNPISFNTDDTNKIRAFKKNLKLDDEASAEDCFKAIKEKYQISNTDDIEARKIMNIRYQISTEGYSSTKPLEISSNISRQSALIFNEQSSDFPGINVSAQPVRNYEQGTVASHIVGYASKISSDQYKNNKDTYDQNDIIGKNGIEYALEDYLRGKDGIRQLDMSVDGTVTDEYISQEAVKGDDVVLTLDLNLQKVTEEALTNTIYKINNGGFGKRYSTNAGAAVVMDVNTGNILAMASYPAYNPQDFVGGISTDKWNYYNTNVYKPLRNKAVQDAYAPGSIYKMVTAIAGLESGVINTTEKIRDTGTFYAYNSSWNCWQKGGHGWVNVTQAIEKSCNVFFYNVGLRMNQQAGTPSKGIDILNKYAKYFGFGSKTGVELPDETSGTLASNETAERKRAKWNGGDMMSAVIGQSYNSFSPLQMVKYVSMVANGGKKITPTLISSVVKADGTQENRDEVIKKVNERLGLNTKETEDVTISQTSINVVKQGMRSVTSDEAGTAYSIFKDFPIEVGGKTGSAETADGAGNGKTNAWFAGFAPYDNPQIAVVVFIENGGHGYYTGETVKNIMQQYFGMNTQSITEDMTAIPYVETFR